MNREEITSVEYRKRMEEQLAYDIWFMNDHMCDEWDDDFSWDKNCILMEFGNGWCYSWYVTCTKLLTEVKSNFHIDQLKEKWGFANVYYSGSITPYGEQLIREFEEESKHICEVCGQPANVEIYSGWTRCLCEDCKKEMEK